jgi:hypothetical protein
MDTFLDVRSLGGIKTRIPNGFRIDRLIAGVVVVAGKEPLAGFSPQVCRRTCGDTRLVFKEGHLLTAAGKCLFNDVFEARAGKVLGARIEEQLRNADVAANGKPRSQAACNSFPD